MRTLQTLLIGCFGATALASATAAATLVAVPDAPNSTKTSVFGIDDDNIFVGSYIGKDDGIEHGFAGSILGNYETFDAGDGGTQARGINNNGTIIGLINSQDGQTSNESIFFRTPHRKIEILSDFAGRGQAINDRGKFAGTYWDFINFDAVAFVGRKRPTSPSSSERLTEK